MKKITAFILVCLMTVSLTSCMGPKNIRGTVDPVSSSEAVEEGFKPGSIGANRYENAFIGIGCELDSNWILQTEEEIRATNQLTLEMMGDEYVNQIENAPVVTDMVATHVNQNDSINVGLEKLAGANLNLSEKDYADVSANSLPGALESMGMANVSAEIGEMDFAGSKHVCIAIEADFDDVKVYEQLVLVKCRGYMAVITACTWGSDTAEEVLGLFYPVA